MEVELRGDTRGGADVLTKMEAGHGASSRRGG
jgi:hypothetical protein